MVDIHSHVLYGLDDGAKDRDLSLAMLRMAADDGTTDIVATPHSDLKYYWQPEEIDRQLADLAQIPGLPRIHRGCDFHLFVENIEDCFQNPSKYTVNGKRYLLVEFANHLIPGNIPSVFDRMRTLGITPIITHPERNLILSKQPDRIAEWVRSGCRIQVTAQSLSGRFGKRAEHSARQLMARGLVHFLASDAHDLEHRPPKLRSAFELVEREYGSGVAATLLNGNPAAVLIGEEVPERIEGMTKPRRWFKLW